MNEEKESKAKRISFLKRAIVIAAIVLLVFPSIICIVLIARQSALQKQLDRLLEELAIMKLNSTSDVGRISKDRIVDLGDYDDDLDPFADLFLVADMDMPDSSDVVWEFSAQGDTIHRVYLTFDDGPSVYTSQILDTLDEYGVKATFFVIGHESEEDYDLYERIVDDGHTLGMHSYSHIYSRVYESTASFTEDFDKLNDLLVNVTGITPKFYRFPGGSSNTVSHIDMHNFIDVLNEKDIVYYDWNVSSGDATGEAITVDQIVANSIYGIEDRDETVILLHDTGAKYNTVLALPKIIEAIQSMDNTQILPITADTQPVQHIW